MFKRQDKGHLDLHNVDHSNIPKIFKLNMGFRTEVNDDVFRDVELCECFSESRSVADEITDFSIFKETKPYVQEILSNPIQDKTTLNKRQRYLQKLPYDAAINHLKNMKDKLSSVKWLLTSKESEIEGVLNGVYFQWWLFRKANNSSYMITLTNIYSILLSPTIGVLSPVVYVLLPFLVLRYKYKIEIPFKLYIKTLYMASTTSLQSDGGNFLQIASYFSFASTIGFYLHGTMQSLDHSKQSHNICRLIHDHAKNILRVYREYQSAMTCSMLEINPFFDFGERVNMKCIDEDFSLYSMDDQSFILSDFGKYLKLYKSLNTEENKDRLRKLMNHMFILDALCSIKKCIVNKNLTKCSYNFSSQRPYIIFKDCRHICLSNDAVGSTFDNYKRVKKNTILTGPNASGKSTFIKGVLINILLSQTIAYNATSESITTPFDYIGSQINIPDCKGKESLFEAEMYRCKNNFDYMKNNQDKKCILFMDELFNSTNFVEGMSGAYSILAHMSALENSMLFVTTHYPQLTKLNEKYNYDLQKFDCEKVNGKITYNYNMVPGICDKYVALDILEEHGYDAGIIDLANEVKDSIITQFMLL